ncbi:hypothetical protein SAMN02910417_02190 [Eubacterium oxidoreducens]|uniref:Uncharacterized protein n=1 Tax=Eubacterium oxidoreducens TaxID=1732 RepID=A0A1G6C8S2_EUBOX|nr:hypothetical protein SAMN02910417_02190 [Eubacterium oxidoreducens]
MEFLDANYTEEEAKSLKEKFSELLQKLIDTVTNYIKTHRLKGDKAVMLEESAENLQDARNIFLYALEGVKESYQNVNINESNRDRNSRFVLGVNELLDATNKELDEYKEFSDRIKDYRKGKMNKSDSLLVMSYTPDILQQVGLDNSPIYMTKKHFKNITHPKGRNGSWHGLTDDEVAQAPVLLAHPAIIADSITENDSIVVVSNSMDSDKAPIIAAIKTDGTGIVNYSHVDSNFMTSFYGKDHDFRKWINNIVAQGNILYKNKKRSQSMSKFLGVQFSAAFDALDFNTIIHPSNNVVKRHLKELSGLNSDYINAVNNNNINKAKEYIKKAAELCLPRTKARNADGSIKEYYHGTNSDKFNKFDKKTIGSANDSGFFGRGFYFATTEGEAKMYGGNIISAYLNTENPYYVEDLYKWNGKAVKDYEGDLSNAIFALNFAKEFPEYKNSVIFKIYDEDGNPIEYSLKQFEKDLNNIIKNVRFVVKRETDYNGNKYYSVNADKVTEDGYSWYEYTKDYADCKGANNKLLRAFHYLVETKYNDIFVKRPRDLIIDNDFSGSVQAKGYDSIFQGRNGDEVVLFDSSQIKRSDVTYDDNGEVVPLSERFNKENKDIRYSLQVLPDGTKYVNVDVDQDIFDGLSLNEKREKAGEILNERYKGKIVGYKDGTPVVETGRGVRHYVRAKRRNYSEEIWDAKWRLSTELDNLLEASVLEKHIPYSEIKEEHPEAINGIDHYKAVFKVGNTYFVGQINILDQENVRTLYDVTKIRETPADEIPTVMDSSLAPRSLPKNIVDYYSEKNNPDIKKSLEVDSEGRSLTKGQQDYFKDSKVRDEEGHLIPVYHGTEADFTVFDLDMARGTEDIEAFFFSDDYDESNGYGSNVGKYYLNITNPADYDTAYDIFFSFKGQEGAGIKTREKLQSLGYDGVIAEDDGYTEYLVFESNQIKSIDNENPTEDPDVRFSLRVPDDIDNEEPTDLDDMRYALDIENFMDDVDEYAAIGSIAKKVDSILSDGSNIKDIEVDRTKINRIARDIIAETNSQYSQKALADNLEKVFRVLKRAQRVSYADLARTIMEVAKPVIDDSAEYDPFDVHRFDEAKQAVCKKNAR